MHTSRALAVMSSPTSQPLPIFWFPATCGKTVHACLLNCDDKAVWRQNFKVSSEVFLSCFERNDFILKALSDSQPDSSSDPVSCKLNAFPLVFSLLRSRSVPTRLLQTDIHSFLGNKPINVWLSFCCECSRL